MKAKQKDETEIVRDKLAALAGWFYHPWGNGGGGWCKSKRYADEIRMSQYQHPIDDKLEEAAMLPKGWWWEKGCFDGYPDHWRAGKNGMKDVYVKESGDEKLDRFQIRLAAEMAEAAKKAVK